MFQHRTYIEKSDDFDKMCALVTYLNGEHSCDWSLGRMFGWKYGRWSEESQIDAVFEKQAELFFDNEGELRGIVITEDIGNSYYFLSMKSKELLCSMVSFYYKVEILIIPMLYLFLKMMNFRKGFWKKMGLCIVVMPTAHIDTMYWISFYTI